MTIIINYGNIHKCGQNGCKTDNVQNRYIDTSNGGQAVDDNGVSDTVASDSALGSAETLLSRVRVPPSAPRPDGGP
ncbi:hypothetical protein PoB_003617600 [Plakobranchus ocellatus]|uniref:Uncharacterized protein n=1 Tax=Plakobranchus ocellatus TaxID=259542 RepID=A0AAV4AEP2_9GAST|nr:hypothetical protein PoB_003617600 [Plakobranchus ocellatus]